MSRTLSSTRRALKRAMLWILAGGLAFWIPLVLLYALFPLTLGLVSRNLASLAGLALLGILTAVYAKRSPSWGWVLAGIYVLGPSAMLLAASFGRGQVPPRLPGDWALMVLFCVLPPTTLWLATLDGMIFSVLLVSVVLPLLGALGRGREPT